MKFCQNCGKQLNDEWSSCPYCNAVQELIPGSIAPEPVEMPSAQQGSAANPFEPASSQGSGYASAQPAQPQYGQTAQPQYGQQAQPQFGQTAQPQYAQQAQPQYGQQAGYTRQQPAQPGQAQPSLSPGYGYGYGGGSQPQKKGKGCKIALIVAGVVLLLVILAGVLLYTIGKNLQNSGYNGGYPSGGENATDHAMIGDFEVTIEEATLVNNYDGEPSILVTFSWTNHSDSEECPIWVFDVSAYQGNKELETTYGVDGNIATLLDGYLTDVPPGGSGKFQVVFELKDSTTQVTVIVRDFLEMEDEQARCTFNIV